MEESNAKPFETLMKISIRNVFNILSLSQGKHYQQILKNQHTRKHHIVREIVPVQVCSAFHKL